MMGAKIVFVDTNVLIYATTKGSINHQQARLHTQTLQDNGFELWISNQIVREYMAAQSRIVPGVMPYPMQDILRQVDVFRKRFRVAEETSAVIDHLVDLAGRFPMGGKQIHDANIVATMMAYGISNLLTYNVSDFKRFSSCITVLSPTI